MIKEIKLINWKSFSEAVLYIDPLTVLIGSNAGGKSSSLKILSNCRSSWLEAASDIYPLKGPSRQLSNRRGQGETHSDY